MQFTPTVTAHVVSRIRRSSVPFALALVALSGTLACHNSATGSTSKVALEVSNRGFFDVNVFVVKSPLTTPIRLGMVTAGQSATFGVPETDLQAGQAMVLQVRAIAGQSSWTSPSLVVSPASLAKLDVMATSSGDLSQTRLYTQVP